MSNLIERLEALAAEATPRPWWNESHVLHAKAPDWTEDNHACVHPAATSLANENYFEDAEFIAAAVNALPDLLKMARAAQEWERCRREREEVRVPFGATPDSYAEMGRMTREAERANGMIRAALEPLFREEDQS